jgi:hypothetical protein
VFVRLGPNAQANRWLLSVVFSSPDAGEYHDGERVFLRVVDLDRTRVDLLFDQDVEYEDDHVNGRGCSPVCNMAKYEVVPRLGG